LYTVFDLNNQLVNRLAVTFQSTPLSTWVLIMILLILLIMSLFLLEIPCKFFDSFKRFLLQISTDGKTGDIPFDKAINVAGYSYDKRQDIFNSNMNAWQRNNGYCRLYDEAAAPLGMVIDCEPIYFEYYGRRWLIEFWKGQYDLTSGCEIGIYSTERADITIPDVYSGPFYNSVKDSDTLFLSFVLKKDGRTLFVRDDRHWWLTGFKLGEFSEPSELTMSITITLKDKIMLDSFTQGLKNAGYMDNEISINNFTVSLDFSKAHTPQPVSQNETTNYIIQMKNKLLCDKYNALASNYENLPDKINAIKAKDPELYSQIINIGKSKELFDTYDKIKSYLY